MIRDYINNKDRGEMEDDGEVKKLPLSPQKLRELMLRSGSSRSYSSVMPGLLMLVLWLLFVFA